MSWVSCEPFVDRRPRLPTMHAVLTRLVATDGSGGPTTCEPAVEHRHRARVRSAGATDTAGSFVIAVYEGRAGFPEGILNAARDFYFGVTAHLNRTG
jgi:hypothetical protein